MKTAGLDELHPLNAVHCGSQTPQGTVSGPVWRLASASWSSSTGMCHLIPFFQAVEPSKAGSLHPHIHTMSESGLRLQGRILIASREAYC